MFACKIKLLPVAAAGSPGLAVDKVVRGEDNSALGVNIINFCCLSGEIHAGCGGSGNAVGR